MRTVLLGVLAVSWVSVACAGGSEAQPPPASPTPAPAPAPVPEVTAPPTASVAPVAPKLSMLDRQKAHMASSMAAWEAHDAKKLAALYSDDVAFGYPSMEGWRETKGRADLEKNMGEFFAAFNDAKVTTVRGFHVGDVVVLEWLLNGTHSGDFMGMKPTGKRLGYRGVSVMWFGDAGVKREHMYFDHITFMGQLGVAPKGMAGRPVMEVPADHKPEWVVASNSEAEKKNAELVSSFFGVWEKKDTKAFLDLLSDDASHVDYSMPTDPPKGKDAAKKQFETFVKAFPDMKMSAKNTWAAGDWVIVESEVTGTFKGALGPLKPTNKTGTLHALDVMQTRGGKMAQGFTYGSGAEFAGAFGLMPPKDKVTPAPGKPPAVAPKPVQPPAGLPPATKPPAPTAKPPAPAAKPPAPAAPKAPPAAPPAGAKPVAPAPVKPPAPPKPAAPKP